MILVLFNVIVHGFRASDGSFNTASAELTIQITDLNDNEPIFDQTAYSETIPENVSLGNGLNKTTCANE